MNELICAYCGRKSTAENPVAYELRENIVSGEEEDVPLCVNAVDCEDYVGLHGNEKQQAEWQWA